MVHPGPAGHLPSGLCSEDGRGQAEESAIAAGDMSTWIQKSFGNERDVMLPTVQSNITADAALDTIRTLQDAKTGLYYTCPSLYFIRPCATCSGPKFRCKSEFSMFFRYITSMYWAYTTMTTVGYGDISATTLAEKIWAIWVMIISGFLFSFTIGRMASVVSKLDAETAIHDEQMDMVAVFLRDTSLPHHMSRRVLDFYKKQKVKPYDSNQVLKALPYELKSKILRHLYASVIRSVPLLQKEADDDMLITDICDRLQPYSCSADTFVYQRGESGGDVFILLKGELHVLDLDHETFLLRIGEGMVFGESNVLRHMKGFEKGKRSENVLCKTGCEMLRISQDDMIDLLSTYPNLYKAMRRMARSRNLQGPAYARNNLASGRMAALDAEPPVPPSDAMKRRMTAEGTYAKLDDSAPLAALKVQGASPDEKSAVLIDLEEAAATPDAAGANSINAVWNSIVRSEAQTHSPDTSPNVSPPPTSRQLLRERETQPSRMSPDRPPLPPAPNKDNPTAVAGIANSIDDLHAEVIKLKRMMIELQRMWQEEAQAQRYMIHQVPGRVMNHMVMVTGTPNEQQQQKLEEATLQWNSKQKWQL